jgi:hypothetical protein
MFSNKQERRRFLSQTTSVPGVCKCWGSERRLSSVSYRNQASGFMDKPLGLDMLRSYSTDDYRNRHYCTTYAVYTATVVQ